MPDKKLLAILACPLCKGPLQHDAAQGVSDLEAPTRPEDFVDARSTRLAARHDADRRRLQGQFISTESDQLPGKRQA